MNSYTHFFKLLPLVGCFVVMLANAANCPGPGCIDPIHSSSENATTATQSGDCPGKGCVDARWSSPAEKTMNCPGSGCTDADKVATPDNAASKIKETKPTKIMDDYKY